MIRRIGAIDVVWLPSTLPHGLLILPARLRMEGTYRTARSGDLAAHTHRMVGTRLTQCRPGTWCLGHYRVLGNSRAQASPGSTAQDVPRLVRTSATYFCSHISLVLTFLFSQPQSLSTCTTSLVPSARTGSGDPIRSFARRILLANLRKSPAVGKAQQLPKRKRGASNRAETSTNKANVCTTEKGSMKQMNITPALGSATCYH